MAKKKGTAVAKPAKLKETTTKRKTAGTPPRVGTKVARPASTK